MRLNLSVVNDWSPAPCIKLQASNIQAPEKLQGPNTVLQSADCQSATQPRSGGYHWIKVDISG